MAAALLHLSQRMAKEMGGTADTIRVDPTRNMKFKDTLATLKMMAMTAAQVVVFAPVQFLPMQGKLAVVSHCHLLCNETTRPDLAGSDQWHPGACHDGPGAGAGAGAGAGDGDAHSPPMQTAKMQTEILEHSSICLPVALGLMYSR